MIYAIQSEKNGPIKIGKADRPWQRMHDLQIASPYLLRLMTYVNWHNDYERKIHKHLALHRLRGEWFRCSDAVLTVVDLMMRDDVSSLNALIAVRAPSFTFNADSGWRERVNLIVGAQHSETTARSIPASPNQPQSAVGPSGEDPQPLKIWCGGYGVPKFL